MYCNVAVLEYDRAGADGLTINTLSDVRHDEAHRTACRIYMTPNPREIESEG